VAKDSDGQPALLVSTVHSGSSLPPPVRLENLSVEHGVDCKIWRGDTMTEEGTFTVLRCRSADANLRDHFLSVGGPLVAYMGANPTPAHVALLVNALVQLFRALSEPARKSVQGLWAELFLIARARDCRAMMRAWHPDPDERYDFSAGAERIEVKCAVGRSRRHYFSLEQVSPPATTVVLIASVCTDRAGGGTSLGNLMTELRARLTLDPELLLRLESVAALTLGRSLLEALKEAYDLELAEQSLRFFDVAAIPRPAGQMPREVSEVRFVADLSSVETTDLALHTGASGLFEAALPR
jgi:hypothetical protein